MECKFAKATFEFSEYFGESVQEMINDGILSNEAQIEKYVKDCLLEDLSNWFLGWHRKEEFENHVTVTLELE